MAELEKQKLSSWNSGSVNRACITKPWDGLLKVFSLRFLLLVAIFNNLLYTPTKGTLFLQRGCLRCKLRAEATALEDFNLFCYTVCTFLNITNHFILGRNFSFLPCKEIQEFQVLFLQAAAAVPVTVAVAVAVAEQVLSVRLRQVQPLHLRVIPFLK